PHEGWARLFSADCGETRTMAGGKVVHGISRLYSDGMKIFEGRVKDEMAGRLISGVRDLTTQHSNEFVRIRAGGVVVDGAAVLLPSPPQAHLPALTGLLLTRGASHLGDEVVNVDPVLRRAHGVPLPLLIDGFDLPLFPAIRREPTRRRMKGPPEEVQAKTLRRPVTVEQLGATQAPPSPIGALVFPFFEEGGDTRLEPFGGAAALFRFTEATLNLHVWTDRAFVLHRELLESVPVSRLVVGSLEDAADLLWSHVAELLRR
ncbi:MAG: hypothetical protein M3273_03270, partial [Actinomycetota bacterium]|nr:hypothetical protein [Actinomycetota bacterium]